MRGIAIAEEGIQELTEVAKYLNGLACGRCDDDSPSALDITHRNIFETTLTDLPQIGSVFSGGAMTI